MILCTVYLLVKYFHLSCCLAITLATGIVILAHNHIHLLNIRMFITGTRYLAQTPFKIQVGDHRVGGIDHILSLLIFRLHCMGSKYIKYIQLTI